MEHARPHPILLPRAGTMQLDYVALTLTLSPVEREQPTDAFRQATKR